MPIVTPTIKGQIVIPAFLRKKFGIVKGTPINIYDENNKNDCDTDSLRL